MNSPSAGLGEPAGQRASPSSADRAEAKEPLPDLLARLGDQLGELALFTPVLVDAWRPEAAWRAVAARPGTLGLSRRRSEPLAVDDPVSTLEAFEHCTPLPRPTLMLPRPERMEVGAPEGLPLRVCFPHTVGWHRVERSAGPERLACAWWESGGGLQRDYWVVRADGRDAWIFRDPTGEWWLHAWFDRLRPAPWSIRQGRRRSSAASRWTEDRRSLSRAWLAWAARAVEFVIWWGCGGGRAGTTGLRSA